MDYYVVDLLDDDNSDEDHDAVNDEDGSDDDCV